MNDFSLKGKTVLLTGAVGFFGQSFSQALLEAGASVILTDCKDEELSCLVAKLKSNYPRQKVIGQVIDQYNRDQSVEILQSISDNLVIDVLINNSFDFSIRTGFNTPNGRLETATYEQLRSSFESGIYWSIESTQILGSKMKDRGKGSIINICSMYSVIVPSPDLYEGTDKFNPPGYSMAKAGLLQFTKYAASFLSPEVRVNAISPGAIPNNELVGPNAIDKDDPVLSRLLNKILLNRMGQPNDLTGALVFLASDAASYITGQNIIIDGGLTVT